MVNNGPRDPLGPFVDEAAQLHELYTTFISVGFNETQAFELVRSYLVSAVQRGAPCARKQERLDRLRRVAEAASVWFITRGEHDLGALESALDALEPGDWPPRAT